MKLPVYKGHHCRSYSWDSVSREKLLEYALQDNIFDPKQRIEYHIFGDGAEFQASHRELSQMSDPVIFHAEHWYGNIPLLESADRILSASAERVAWNGRKASGIYNGYSF